MSPCSIIALVSYLAMKWIKLSITKYKKEKKIKKNNRKNIFDFYPWLGADSECGEYYVIRTS